MKTPTPLRGYSLPYSLVPPFRLFVFPTDFIFSLLLFSVSPNINFFLISLIRLRNFSLAPFYSSFHRLYLYPSTRHDTENPLLRPFTYCPSFTNFSSLLFSFIYASCIYIRCASSRFIGTSRKNGISMSLTSR